MQPQCLPPNSDDSSGWRAPEKLDAFTSSPDYSLYLECFGRDNNPSPPHITITTRIDANSLQGCISIHTLSFPHPATDEQRQRVNQIRGISLGYRTGPDYVADSFNRGMRTQIVWIEKPQEIDGKTVENAMVIHFWKDQESEAEIKSKHPDALERWRTELDRLGLVAVKEEHCELFSVC
jgi:hypothetical protein